jgi:hypothetical protein
VCRAAGGNKAAEALNYNRHGENCSGPRQDKHKIDSQYGHVPYEQHNTWAPEHLVLHGPDAHHSCIIADCRQPLRLAHPHPHPPSHPHPQPRLHRHPHRYQPQVKTFPPSQLSKGGLDQGAIIGIISSSIGSAERRLAAHRIGCAHRSSRVILRYVLYTPLPTL